MATTKALTLTTAPQNIIVLTVCSTVLIKEDESVVGWPTVALILKKNSGDADTLTAGKSYTFQSPAGKSYLPGLILGTLATALGSTTGIQDEQ